MTVLGQAGGSLTANVAPLSGSEITRSVPPIRSTSSREILRNGPGESGLSVALVFLQPLELSLVLVEPLQKLAYTPVTLDEK